MTSKMEPQRRGDGFLQGVLVQFVGAVLAAIFLANWRAWWKYVSRPELVWGVLFGLVLGLAIIIMETGRLALIAGIALKEYPRANRRNAVIWGFSLLCMAISVVNFMLLKKIHSQIP